MSRQTTARSSFIKLTDVPGSGPEPWCGTVGGYANHGCRCDGCRAEWAAKTVQMRADRRKLLPTLPDEMHGKASTYYNYGCRCGPCRADLMERQRQRHRRVVA